MSVFKTLKRKGLLPHQPPLEGEVTPDRLQVLEDIVYEQAETIQSLSIMLNLADQRARAHQEVTEAHRRMIGSLDRRIQHMTKVLRGRPC